MNQRLQPRRMTSREKTRAIATSLRNAALDLLLVDRRPGLAALQALMHATEAMVYVHHNEHSAAQAIGFAAGSLFRAREHEIDPDEPIGYVLTPKGLDLLASKGLL